jgi:hypothetical protein
VTNSRRSETIENVSRSWIAATVTLISVAAVFWSGACANHREEEPTAAAASDAGSPPAAVPSPVEEYIQFVATAGDSRSGLSDDLGMRLRAIQESSWTIALQLHFRSLRL